MRGTPTVRIGCGWVLEDGSVCGKRLVTAWCEEHQEVRIAEQRAEEHERRMAKWIAEVQERTVSNADRVLIGEIVEATGPSDYRSTPRLGRRGTPEAAKRRDHRDVEILKLREEGYTLTEIGYRFGITASRVGQLAQRAEIRHP